MSQPAPISVPKGYQRLGAFPLDASSVFATLAELETYASTNGTAYAGQVCAVSGTGKVYVIQSDKSLLELGAGSGDGGGAQADWNATSGPSQILNKPGDFVGITLDENNQRVNGTTGLVPAPLFGATDELYPIPPDGRVLKSDGTWGFVPGFNPFGLGEITLGLSEAPSNQTVLVGNGSGRIILPSPAGQPAFTPDPGSSVLARLEDIAQPDWNASEGPAQILNKPDISGLEQKVSWIDYSGQPGDGGWAYFNNQVSSGSIIQAPVFQLYNGPFETDIISEAQSLDKRTIIMPDKSGTVALLDDIVSSQPDWNATEGPAQILNKPPITDNGAGNVSIEGQSLFCPPIVSATTIDAITVAVGGMLGGVLLTAPSISTLRTVSFPDKDGTVALLDDIAPDWDATEGPSQILNKPEFGTLALQNADTVEITGGSITGLPEPTTSSDAATKSYVDAAVENAGGGGGLTEAIRAEIDAAALIYAIAL